MIYELEVRLYELFCSDLFVSFLQKKYESYLIDKISDTVYIFPDRVRYILKDDILNKMEKNIIMEKKFQNKKFAISTESPTLKKDYKLKDAESIRKRVREIYSFPSGIELHITRINNLNYEVEIEQEINISEDDWEENNEQILDNFQLNFDKLFEEIERYSKCLNIFLQNFNGNTKNQIGIMNKNVIAKLRDIEKKDFITENGRGLHEGYTVTVKADGIPVILYFKNRYLFLISPYIYFRLIRELKKDYSEEFMIIGEYINSFFIPFDILFSSRRKDIRNHPNHLERLEMAYDILDRNSKDIISDSGIKIFKKDFIPIGKTPKSFAKAYVKIKETVYPFENDGMVLTPIYYPQNRFLPKDLKHRQLSQWAEPCKIKPWSKLSIDFTVNIIDREVYTSYETKPYKGNFKFPFDSKTIIDWKSIPSEMNNKIVELYPVKISEEDFVLKFSRERTDKDEPNHQTTVDRVWKKIIDPLDEKIFLGKYFSRLRLQNNRVKTNLINTIPKKSIVIDIGSGFGGDIFKYNNIADIVICIEPNDKNRTKLLNRLKNAKHTLKTKYEVLSCGGEDTETVMETFKPIRNSLPQAEVVISSMLSLTFFWKNKEYLGLFKRTLKEISKYSNGALFYFYTVEGYRFKKYLEENGNKINNSAFRVLYDPTAVGYGVGIPGRLKIEIFDTIVSLQREYLVDLSDLDDITTNLTFKSGKIENYLTEDESKYAECHVYGTARIN